MLWFHDGCTVAVCTWEHIAGGTYLSKSSITELVDGSRFGDLEARGFREALGQAPGQHRSGGGRVDLQ